MERYLTATANDGVNFVVFVLHQYSMRVTVFNGGFYLPEKQYDKEINGSIEPKEIIETELLHISGNIDKYKITYNS